MTRILDFLSYWSRRLWLFRHDVVCFVRGHDWQPGMLWMYCARCGISGRYLRRL